MKCDSYVAATAGIDVEMLAILLWDYFGTSEPRSYASVSRGVPTANEGERERYRQCAADIAKRLAVNAASQEWRR